MIEAVKEEMDLGGRRFVFETGKYAKQANGSVMVHYGDTVVLVTATMSDPRPGIDFLPLMVNYEERIYAIGKIPGSVTRREGMPRDVAKLTARLIDRPLRPLFPDGFRNDVQIIATVLSVDGDNDPEIMGLNGASMALILSDIPFYDPIGGVKVGLIDDQLILNPTEEQQKESLLNLTVAGTKDAVMMVEAGANELSEEKILEALEFGHEAIKELIDLQLQLGEKVGKEKGTFEVLQVDPALEERVSNYASHALEEALKTGEKLARNEQVKTVQGEVLDHFREVLSGEIGDEEGLKSSLNTIKKILNDKTKELVRKMILEEGQRTDERRPDEIREIWCEVGVLPRAHGSGIFTRGQTQALTVATLGAVGDEQILFGLGEDAHKRYMHHYNFPPFSVGETSPLRAPGRREIGHGALGERALVPVLPAQEDFPYTIRLVSEVLESNGSSSQASICGCTLALMDAGVPIKAPVAGIAMGLMKEDDKVAILSDIQGLEDHYGDMDFKVAGTREGITSLQMDIKIKGVSRSIMEGALEQARKGRLYILDLMKEVIAEPRPELSPYAPSMFTLKIHPDKIRNIIGPGGKTINKIIAETNVEIDIEDDGTVYILARDKESGEEARKIIDNLTRDVVVGEIYQGTVKKIMNFGAFVEVLPGQEGLVHISKLANHHVKKVEDVLSVGDEVFVKVTGIDNQGRINLSRKACLDGEGDKG